VSTPTTTGAMASGADAASVRAKIAADIREVRDEMRSQGVSATDGAVTLGCIVAKHEAQILAALASPPPVVPEEVRRKLASCSKEEIAAWEAYGEKAGLDMHEHPLHYLFLDDKTYAARHGWKAGIEWALSLLAAATPSKPVGDGPEASAPPAGGGAADIAVSGPVNGMGEPDTSGPYLKLTLSKGERRQDVRISIGAAECLMAELDGLFAPLAAAPAAPEPAAGGDYPPGIVNMLSADNRAMRAAGTQLAEAALRVIREYDGCHRLSLAVAEWSKVLGDEGGRGERHSSNPKPTPANAGAEGGQYADR